MPRRIKQKAIVGVKAVKRGRPKADGWRKVSRVELDTAQLIEVGPDHHYWNGNCGRLEPRQGSIVKLIPPPGTDESTVLAMERNFYDGGAVSVKVMPTQEEAVVTIDGEDFDFTGGDLVDERPLRQVALERAARVTNPHDAKALTTLVNWAMDKAEAQA